MSAIEKSAFLKKLIKEAVTEALTDKDVLATVLEKVIDYNLEQQLKLMETMKKEIISEIAGQIKLVEAAPVRRRSQSVDVEDEGEGEDMAVLARKRQIAQQRIREVSNVTKKMFNGKDVLSNITKEQLDQLPQYRKDKRGQIIEVAPKTGINVEPLSGMFKGQFSGAAIQEESAEDYEMPQQTNKQAPPRVQRANPPMPQQGNRPSPIKIPDRARIQELESRCNADLIIPESMAPMMGGGLLGSDEIDMGDNVMYDGGYGDDEFQFDPNALMADPSDFEDPM